MPSYTPVNTEEAYDGDFITAEEAGGTRYMIQRRGGRYFGMIPGNDVENVNVVEHSTVMTAGKKTEQAARKAIRSIAKHLPKQHE